LLPKTLRRRPSSRKHEGTVTVGRSNVRWCSDGLEIRCDSGQTVTATFAKDCCDREVIAWRAWEGKGLPGEPVREMLIEAVDKRVGSVEALPADHRLEFLSDNGSADIAADTRALARSLGLTPINTPVCSPQSSGIAEYFDEVHPHSSLKMRSPLGFRRHPAAQARRSTVQEAVLHCE
jgi:putative transposase